MRRLAAMLLASSLGTASAEPVDFNEYSYLDNFDALSILGMVETHGHNRNDLLWQYRPRLQFKNEFDRKRKLRDHYKWVDKQMDAARNAPRKLYFASYFSLVGIQGYDFDQGVYWGCFPKYINVVKNGIAVIPIDYGPLGNNDGSIITDSRMACAGTQKLVQESGRSGTLITHSAVMQPAIGIKMPNETVAETYHRYIHKDGMLIQIYCTLSEPTKSRYAQHPNGLNCKVDQIDIYRYTGQTSSTLALRWYRQGDRFVGKIF